MWLVRSGRYSNSASFLLALHDRTIWMTRRARVYCVQLQRTIYLHCWNNLPSTYEPLYLRNGNQPVMSQYPPLSPPCRCPLVQSLADRACPSVAGSRTIFFGGYLPRPSWQPVWVSDTLIRRMAWKGRLHLRDAS